MVLVKGHLLAFFKTLQQLDVAEDFFYTRLDINSFLLPPSIRIILLRKSLSNDLQFFFDRCVFFFSS